MKYIIWAVVLIAVVVFIFQAEGFRAGIRDFFDIILSPYSTSSFPGGYYATTSSVTYTGYPSYKETKSPTYISEPKYEPQIAGNRSPYYRKVRAESVSLGFGSGINSQVLYRARLAPNEVIDVNGWQLQTSRGIFFIPPFGSNYSSGLSGFPSQNIALSNGSAFIVHAGPPPSGQANPNPDNTYPYENSNYNPPTYYGYQFFREYHFWMNFPFLDPYHDTVSLYDRQGKLVDEYKY